MPYPFSGQAPVICCPALLGRALGVPRKIFSASDRPKPPALPRFPSGRLYSHSEGRITFCKDVFPWMLCLSGIGRTHHVRRRSASVTFRGAGACPSSRVRDVGHPVRGGAGPRRPQARRRVYLRDHQRQVRALPLKTALSAPNQRIIKRIPPSILSMTRIRCCAAPKSSPPTMSTASAS